MSELPRILLISHGHPDFVAGGGELAAYQLHQALRENSRYDSVFMARHARPERTRAGTALSGNGRESEILFYSTMPDWFRFSQPDKARIWNEFREVLKVTRPDLVHFHHYLHLGVEFIREVREFCPELPIVLTLHEFFAICHNHGQMVRTNDRSRCERSTPADCAHCFPDYSPQDFYLRERFIKSYFNLVDYFIAPSHFLKQRYVEWGLPAEKIKVVDNVQVVKPADSVACAPAGASVSAPVSGSVSIRDENAPVRCSFFGQINKFKGVDILLDAIERLPLDIRERLTIDLNGSGLDQLKSPMREQMTEQLESLSDCVNLRGPYRREELSGLMQNSEWVIVPSTWWENAPMVIEEARQFGVPVICSNIGGMAEKVEHNSTGLHFRVSDAASLADQLNWVVTHRNQQPLFAERMADSFNRQRAVTDHCDLYEALLNTSADTSMLRVA